MIHHIANMGRVCLGAACGLILVGNADLAKRAKSAEDGAESIRAECPTAWKPNREPRGWRYVCPATKTEILCLEGPHGCGLKGSTKGDKSASWVK